jgi:formylglycine-generating enzyme required for sulfatase activity
MEFVDGNDLTKLVKARGPLPVHEACEYVRQAALGLHHAHERGMVHRDIKPSNLMATPAGQVKVLDLGLALLNETAESAENRLTQVGYVIGTPDFLAPEQARDPVGVDARADVYALGCTLFYLLAARPPYEGANATEKLLKHVTDPVPSLLPVRPGLPPQLDAVVRWMLAKHPGERPQSTVQAAAALQPYCSPGGVPPSGSPAAPQPLSNSAVFRLPAGEAPARVRERDARHVSAAPLFVTAVAVVALIVAGYLVVAVADPPPAPHPAAYTIDRIGLRMVRLDGGTFVMGSPDGEPGRGPDEGPTGEVTLAGPFYVAATEVTNGQFTRVMGRSPAVLATRAATRDVPVDSVTWPEAVEFCRRLSELDGNRRPAWAYRLPSEAEWEYACRAGSTGPFAGGDRLSANRQAYFTPGPNDPLADGELPHPPARPGRVGQTESNRFGLYDLHGNVWEWCGDYHARAYPPGPRANPTGPAAGDLRVVRGGAFDQPASKCRSAARKGLPPDTRETNVGFRVVFAAEVGG